MRKLIIIAAVILMTGCAGTSVQSLNSDRSGDYGAIITHTITF